MLFGIDALVVVGVFSLKKGIGRHMQLLVLDMLFKNWDLVLCMT